MHARVLVAALAIGWAAPVQADDQRLVGEWKPVSYVIQGKS